MLTADYVEYRRLATHLNGLDLHAGCGSVIERVRAYPGAQWLVGVLLQLSPESDAWAGIVRIAESLKAQNPRFDVGVFEEWVLDEL